MSIKASLTKMAIKMTPNMLIIWVSNIILKDIAKLTGFNFDIDTRQLFVQVHLVGESETIDVWLEDFAIITEDGTYKFYIHKASSNRIWLGNILSRIVNKEWKIPIPSHLASHFDFIAEVFKADKLEQDDN